MPATDEQLLALRDSFNARIDALLTPSAPPAPPILIDPPAIADPALSSPLALSSPRFLKSAAALANRTVANMSLAYKLADLLTIDGLTIADHQLTGCGGLMRVYKGKLLNTLIERIAIVEGRYYPGVSRGVFMTGNAEVSNLTIRGVRCRYVTPITSAGDIYAGITLGGKDADDFGKGFLFEDLDMEGFWADYTGTASEGRYPNCDAIAIERGYISGIIRRCRLANGSDAGIDRKGLDWRVEHVLVENFRENLKTWANAHDGAIESRFARFAHFMVMAGAEHVIDFVRAVGSDPSVPLVQFEGAPGVMRILNADFSGLPENQVWARADTAAKGSTLILPDRTIQL